MKSLKRKMYNKILLLLPIIFFGCNYKLGMGESFSQCGICVPYIQGDLDGLFTSELIYSLKSSGLFSEDKKALTLKVKICNELDQEIGWREDFKVTKNEKRVIVVEKRKIIVLEVFLCNGSEICWGPRKIRSFVEYDFFDPDSLNGLSFILDGVRVPSIAFSLGQLTSEDDALMAAKPLLYRKLSKKIVDQISLEW